MRNVRDAKIVVLKCLKAFGLKRNFFFQCSFRKAKVATMNEQTLKRDRFCTYIKKIF